MPLRLTGWWDQLINTSSLTRKPYTRWNSAFERFEKSSLRIFNSYSVQNSLGQSTRTHLLYLKND